MSTALRTWADAAWQTLRSLPGIADKDLVGLAWKHHNDCAQPIVTVFGVYDAGKSSLIKRLRVDDGGDIPEWLTVSSRPETFTVQETQACGCVLRDTPGISVRDDHHEYLALNALAASDVVLVVLPPQLFTSERESVLEILRGGLYGIPTSAAYGARSLMVVLSRADLLGADPVSRPKAFSQVIARKKREFQAVLEKNDIDTRRIEFRAVSADPSGMVADDQNAASSDYDESRSWDGIKVLSDWVRELPQHLPELRLYAQVRHLGFVLGGLRASLEGEARTLAAALRTVGNGFEQQNQLAARLETTMDAAWVELQQLFTQDTPFTIDTLRAWDVAHTARVRDLITETDKLRAEHVSSYSWRRVSDSLLPEYHHTGETENHALASAEVIEMVYEQVRRAAIDSSNSHDMPSYVSAYANTVLDEEATAAAFPVDTVPTQEHELVELWGRWSEQGTIAALTAHIQVIADGISVLHEHLKLRHDSATAVLAQLEAIMAGTVELIEPPTADESHSEQV